MSFRLLDFLPCIEPFLLALGIRKKASLSIFMVVICHENQACLFYFLLNSEKHPYLGSTNIYQLIKNYLRRILEKSYDHMFVAL